MKMDNINLNSSTASAAGWMQQSESVSTEPTGQAGGNVGKTGRRRADGREGTAADAQAGFEAALTGATLPARATASPAETPVSARSAQSVGTAVPGDSVPSETASANPAPAMSPMQALRGMGAATAAPRSEASVGTKSTPVAQETAGETAGPTDGAPKPEAVVPEGAPAANASVHAQLQSNHAIPQSTVSQPKTMEGGREQAARSPMALQAAALVSAEAPASALLSQGTLQAASSTNTGSAIAGLKPWSREWVFNGTEEANPDLRTLFGEANSAAAPVAARDLLAKLSAVELPARKGADAAEKATNAAPTTASPEQATRSPDAREQGSRSKPVSRLQSPAPAVMGGDTAALRQMIQAGEVAVIPATLLRDALDFEARSEDEDSVGIAGDEAMPKRMGSEIAGQTAARSVGGAEYLEMIRGVRSQPNALAKPQGSETAPFPAGSSARATVRSNGAGDAGTATVAGRIVSGDLRSRQEGGPKGPRGLVDGASDEFVRAFEAQRAGIQAAASRGPADAGKPVPMMLNAQVTQGSKLRDRLSSDALVGLASGIRGLGPQGGGEIRMRLKPEGLGEVHLKIVARGNDVGLKIQASNETAKKILEESLGFLKESLASNQLNLVRTDVSVGTLLSSNDGAGQGQSQQQQHSGQSALQPDFSGMAGQQTGQFGAAFGQSGGSRQGLWNGDADEVGGTRGGAGRRTAQSVGLAATTAARRPADSSRLDVMA